MEFYSFAFYVKKTYFVSTVVVKCVCVCVCLCVGMCLCRLNVTSSHLLQKNDSDFS